MLISYVAECQSKLGKQIMVLKNFQLSEGTWKIHLLLRYSKHIEYISIMKK